MRDLQIQTGDYTYPAILSRHAFSSGEKRGDELKLYSMHMMVCLYCQRGGKQMTTCSECGRSMINMGSKVKLPKKGDKKGWKALLDAYPGVKEWFETDYYRIWSVDREMWWKPHSSGYTDKKAKAGLYPKEDAEAIVKSANIFTLHEKMELVDKHEVPFAYYQRKAK